MKKLLAILVASVLCLSMAAIAEETYTVGICQLVQHPALDAATQGFQDALTEKLGDAVTFDMQNASGDSNTCSTIVNGFVSGSVDLIMANATGGCHRRYPDPRHLRHRLRYSAGHRRLDRRDGHQCVRYI